MGYGANFKRIRITPRRWALGLYTYSRRAHSSGALSRFEAAAAAAAASLLLCSVVVAGAVGCCAATVLSLATFFGHSGRGTAVYTGVGCTCVSAVAVYT